MADPSSVQALMREIGPFMGLEQVTEFDGGREWALLADEATIVHADYLEADERLLLAIELGRPPEASRHRVYELLLLYNHAWPETGGVRMALQSEGGPVVQLFETGAADLDLAGLSNVLGGFIALARHWRGAILRGTETASADVDRMMMMGAIRG